MIFFSLKKLIHSTPLPSLQYKNNHERHHIDTQLHFLVYSGIRLLSADFSMQCLILIFGNCFTILFFIINIFLNHYYHYTPPLLSSFLFALLLHLFSGILCTYSISTSIIAKIYSTKFTLPRSQSASFYLFRKPFEIWTISPPPLSLSFPFKNSRMNFGR